ncbi:DUF3108 domain-containing protein [Pseudoruegeria sp. HB172150]|uniref:DUF3108 domain-containing protein n=1 Tax=Pseudoruegeria sp. HB172150 TaxID=2721164 RepID=UPI0015550D81|nr:DUF3108 domain-containing protein [Pseudoruegeria sp. HB172150]
MTRLILPLLLILLQIAAPARAEETVAEFTIGLRGVTIGTLRLSGLRSEERYSASAAINSVGVAEGIHPFSYRGKVEGEPFRDGYIPGHYEESINTGRRQSSAVIEYWSGVPKVLSVRSLAATAADSPVPHLQGDALDPLTVLFDMMRDRQVGPICNRRHFLFDGVRRSMLRLGAPAVEGDLVTCYGEYRRLKGFAADEMARQRSFSLAAVYEHAAGRLRLVRVDVDSVYGVVTLHRR